MKKPVRLFLFGAAALLVLLLGAVLLAFNSGFQTWIARRQLAARPELGATIGTVAAGLHRVEVKNVKVDSHGVVLTLPALEVELPLVAAGMNKKVSVTKLVAKGWTLDLSKAKKVGQVLELTRALADAARPAERRAGSGEFSLLPSARAADPAPAASALTLLPAGIFSQLNLPVDLAVDGVDLEGEVILPDARGHARLVVTGGGLASGREGKFDVVLTAALTSGAVSTLEARTTLTATMDTPRTFTNLGLKSDATASGAQFPRGVKLSVTATATTANNDETYAVDVVTDRPIATIKAVYSNLTRPNQEHAGPVQMRGTWTLDARDTDLSPFTLGRALPEFTANGKGELRITPSPSPMARIDGTLDLRTDKLGVIRPELAAVGALRFGARFGVTQSGNEIKIESLSLDVSGAQPVAKIATLQAITYTPATHAVAAADPARDLFSVSLEGLPLAWAQPFAPGLVITGADLKGEFVATASAGGFSLRPKAPLVAAGVSVTQADKPLLKAVDLSLSPSVDYTPQGWQVSAAPLLLRSGDATLLTLEAKAGQLAGAGQPIKATGKFSATLPALLAQPVAGGQLQLTQGDAAGNFAASLGATKELQAKLALTNLAADPKVTTEKLPAVSVDLRADIAASGQITVNAPLLVERDGRKSDLSLVGTLTPDPKGLTIAGRVSSTKLVLDDVKILAAPLAPPPAPAAAPATPQAPAAPTKPDTAPPWAGITGQIALALKEVTYSGAFQATDVAGTLRLDAGAAKLDAVRVGLGNGSDAKISGAVTFDPKAAAPYALNADLAVTEFDPAPLFKALNPGQPATVEGKFNVTSKLSGQAARLNEFATTTHGDFNLTSKGGVFRGLPVNVSSKVETTSKVAAGVALLGNLAGAMTGRKEYSDIGTRAQALSEVTKIWQAINYDQLGVVISRDADLNTTLKDFTLISPELRLTGGGKATHVKNKPLLDEEVAMEFKLRARGHHAELLKYLGALDSTTDELGYAACTLPIKVGGTLGKPDTSELNNALAAMAIEKSGVKDKAGELLKGLFGK